MERLSGPPIGLYCYNIAPYDINTFCQVKFFKLIIKILLETNKLIRISLGNQLYIYNFYFIL